MTDKELIGKWNKDVAKALIGKRIVNASYMTDAEMNHLGWYKRALVIIFDDHSVMYASADDEGNDAGSLFTTIEGLEVIPTI